MYRVCVYLCIYYINAKRTHIENAATTEPIKFMVYCAIYNTNIKGRAFSQQKGAINVVLRRRKSFVSKRIVSTMDYSVLKLNDLI